MPDLDCGVIYRPDDADFEVSKRLAQKMAVVLSEVENVGQGADAIGILFAFYLCRVRDAGVVSPKDAIELASIINSQVLERLDDQPLQSDEAVH
jgi:hypothetical protein